tara:strand:- start:254 stop:436 length:183 start_codon:yes stop_codon:yes gene_type:complete
MSKTIEKIIKELPTPIEMANQLKDNGHFSADQAGAIAAEIYQPLVNIIRRLNTKIDYHDC